MYIHMIILPRKNVMGNFRHILTQKLFGATSSKKKKKNYNPL